MLRFDKLGQTVLLPILFHPVPWLILITYGTTAALTRHGTLVFDQDDLEDGRNAFDGSGILITFMIVFYVGYCYNRYSSMFADLEVCVRSIINTCAVARVASSQASLSCCSRPRGVTR